VLSYLDKSKSIYPQEGKERDYNDDEKSDKEGKLWSETILADFLRFTHAGGNPDALVARRTTEANLFNNGIY